MYDNFLWGGCSFSWGSGFYQFTENETAMWLHEDFPKIFNYGSYNEKLNSQELQLSILPFTFPNLIGKKLSCKNIQNLSMPGLGTSIHIRRLVSYIESNKDKLDFSKTFVGLQLTSLARVDLINANLIKDEEKWIFAYVFNDHHFQGNGVESFWKNHFDFDFYILKHLNEILLFKRYLDSFGIDNFFVGLSGLSTSNMKIEKNNEVYSSINQTFNHPIQLESLRVNEFLKEIEYYEISKRISTLRDDGVDDSHFSVQGHQQVAEELYNYIKSSNRYKI